MLELNDIKKDYYVAGETVQALKGISLKFRKSEFVSILGPSGCGKTTLLNIIGGLDKYTSGDLVIEGTSTKQYGDRDWDTYRNHSIGFIFQSYHLIPHQTILQNVELALMISGVSKQERRQRALEALEKVGLKDKINNRPNQLSGGQAQRVAIARALINDPEIVLADEPTGALDSTTSVQIMELLKEISKDRLIIMVTHNPELAEQYSTRIVRLLDGEVVDDTMPYDGADEKPAEPVAEQTAEAAAQPEGVETQSVEGGAKTNKGNKKKTSMSIGMALSLSLKNLLSKSKRTAMVSVAGSIGIIGVSLVLAISSGVQSYIRNMEEDMLSGNPVAITRSAIDFSSLMDMSNSSKPKVNITKLNDKLYVQSLMETLGGLAKDVTKTNEITTQYIDYIEHMDAELTHVVQYDYGFSLANNIYTNFKVKNEGDYSASQVTSVAAIRGMYQQILSEQPAYSNFAGTVASISTFSEVPDNYEYVLSQYDIIAAETSSGVVYDAKQLSVEQQKAIFADKQSLIMVVDDSMITDIALGQYGYFTQEEFLNYAFDAIRDDDGTNESYNEQLGLVGSGITNGEADPENGLAITGFIGPDSKKFTWYPNDEVYYKYTTPMGSQYYHMPYLENNFLYRAAGEQNGVPYPAMEIPFPEDSDLDKDKGLQLDVKLILQKKSGISYSCLEPGFYYTNALTKHMLESSRESRIVKDIEASEKGYLDILPYSFYYTAYDKVDGNTVLTEKKGTSAIYEGGNFMHLMASGLSSTGSSDLLHVTAAFMGGGKLPSAIYIYPTDFDAKNAVCEYLDKWNEMCENGDGYCVIETVENDDGSGLVSATEYALNSSMKITYTDAVGMIINMINTMIQMITIALVAFTALSLVVSTVMIGIITYVSVVERVKEIGILRAVGARKKDIKRLFNAETFIIGLVAGLFGILVTYLLSLVINVIVVALAGIWGIAALPWWQAIIMVLISVGLTLISGLIPAAAAAKKDPVVALRTE
ncbi:MAG: ABC transporter ATP-binding protein/permease [Clostridia bacterium]|nr:ABC transporter ATP-binding protein/permease [Clostridia bacterium]